MATTNASISISSSDMIPGMAMSYYKTTALHKAGGCIGLSKIQSGSKEFSSASIVDLLATTEAKLAGANKLYVKNLSTNTEEYFTITIHAEELGRLYAGDWMFIPWTPTDTSDDVRVTPSVASSMKLEYILLHE
tara:strand:- start:10 stop:411 length:402 start_codon:yes stop_codon:yes gene_type:complete